jgi:hypothetical protein
MVAVTMVAAWYVASGNPKQRKRRFWPFLLSNVPRVVWRIHAQAHALIVLQLCLAAMNMSHVQAATTSRSPS